ncbi:hypothetical protein HID58_025995 [Brassica napus]|uniref:Uncharacterized protein n=1 Tax=Brassica napus TaxID=3708 RepID=A0ABQ8CMM7_BRANA|nr:hypothetical protein HID58_025995 [Brassica napus]
MLYVGTYHRLGYSDSVEFGRRRCLQTSVELNYLIFRYLQESGLINAKSMGIWFHRVLLSSLFRKGAANIDEDFSFFQPLDLISKDVKELQVMLRERKREERHKDKDRERSKENDKERMKLEREKAHANQLGDGDRDMAIDQNEKENAGDEEHGPSSGRCRTTMTPTSLPSRISNSDVRVLEGHTAEVCACAWSPSASLLASGSGDTTARIWSIPESGRSISTLILKHAKGKSNEKCKDVTTLDWNVSSALVRGLYLQLVLMHEYEYDTGCNCNIGPTLDVDWRNNVSFATSSTDTMIYLSKIGETRPVKTFAGHQGEVNCVKWDPTGTLLASCSDDSTAKMWNVKQHSFVHDLRDHSKEIYTIRWSPTGPGTNNPNKPLTLASASFDSTVKIWDAELGKMLCNLNGHRDAVYSLAFSPNGEYIVSGSVDKSIHIWSLKEGKIVKTYTGAGGIFEVCWNKEGNKLAACFADNSVSVLDFRINNHKKGQATAVTLKMSEPERARPLLASEERAYEDTEKVHIVGVDEEDGADYDDELGNSPRFSWKKLWLFTGPGFLMSIAFLDPGNLESDLQAGAIAGYSLIWLLMWATAIGLLIQLLSARLGVATGRHLAELCREEYPTWARMVLWIMAEIALIGADIQEVIGSAIAIKILSNGLVPLWAGVVITALDCFIFLFLENYGIRKLEAVFAILIATMALAFAWMTIKQAVGIVGCIIMPHNVFLHSALVQSRKVDPKKRFRVKEALKYYSIESTGALAVSFIINVFVTTVFAKAFYGTDIADTIGLANAGQYLQDKYGGGFFPILYIWAIGVLAAGQSSTITGTYAGQFIMGGFLNLKMKKWVRALITRSCAIVPTMIVALVFDSSDSMLDELNEWLNVLQSVQIPFAVIPLLCLVSNEQIMGSFKIQPLVQTISWIVAALVIAINGYLMVDFFSGAATSVALLVPVIIFAVAYVVFVLYLISRGLTYTTPWQLVSSQKVTERDDE